MTQKAMQHNDPRLQIVRDFRMNYDPPRPPGEIAEELNDAGFPPPIAGEKWTSSTVLGVCRRHAIE